jgi:predicted nucleic acid-binding protein
MVLLDTSLWIEFFSDRKNQAAQFVEDALNNQMAVCVNAVIEMEILQGIREDKLHRQVKEILVNFQYFPDLSRDYFDMASDIFRRCRKSGITVRKSLDCLIAANCLIDGLVVAHRDRDFELIKSVFPDLQTISTSSN